MAKKIELTKWELADLTRPLSSARIAVIKIEDGTITFKYANPGHATMMRTKLSKEGLPDLSKKTVRLKPLKDFSKQVKGGAVITYEDGEFHMEGKEIFVESKMTIHSEGSLASIPDEFPSHDYAAADIRAPGEILYKGVKGCRGLFKFSNTDETKYIKYAGDLEEEGEIIRGGVMIEEDIFEQTFDHSKDRDTEVKVNESFEVKVRTFWLSPIFNQADDNIVTVEFDGEERPIRITYRTDADVYLKAAIAPLVE